MGQTLGVGDCPSGWVGASRWGTAPPRRRRRESRCRRHRWWHRHPTRDRPPLRGRGEQVFVVGGRAEVLEEVAAERGDIVAGAGDLSPNRPMSSKVVETIVEVAGTVDVLVTNAGGTRHAPPETLAQVAEHWMAGCSRAPLRSAHRARPAPAPALTGGGVVAIGSSTARNPAGNAAYGASNAALHRWMLPLGDAIGGLGGNGQHVGSGVRARHRALG